VSESITMGHHGRRLMDGSLYRAVTARIIAPWALQGLRPRGEGLEIGAGVGAMSAQLMRSFGDLRMVVTDYDPDMVAAAARALRPFGSRAQLEVADANRLPFAERRFDLVVSCLMLHHTGDWRETVREAVRVLRPGGHLVGFDLVAGAPLHNPQRFEGQLLRPDELRELFAVLPVTQVRVRPALVRSVVRFMATKKP